MVIAAGGTVLLWFPFYIFRGTYLKDGSGFRTQKHKTFIKGVLKVSKNYDNTENEVRRKSCFFENFSFIYTENFVGKRLQGKEDEG